MRFKRTDIYAVVASFCGAAIFTAVQYKYEFWLDWVEEEFRFPFRITVSLGVLVVALAVFQIMNYLVRSSWNLHITWYHYSGLLREYGLSPLFRVAALNMLFFMTGLVLLSLYMGLSWRATWHTLPVAFFIVALPFGGIASPALHRWYKRRMERRSKSVLDILDVLFRVLM